MEKITFFLKKIALPIFLGLFFLAFLGATGAFFFLRSNADFVKNYIVDEMSKEIGYDVEIASIEEKWNLTNPSIIINKYKIYNQNHDKSIDIDRIEVDLSWFSLVKLEPILNRIELTNPTMDIVRETDGSLTFNGISFTHNESSGSFSNWLLNQDEFIIVDGNLTWQDKTRGDDKLELSGLNINYDSSGPLTFTHRHNFNASTYMNRSSPEIISVSGHIDLGKLENLDEIDGNIRITLNQFQLTSLGSWVDYPMNLLSGQGDLDIKIDIDQGLLKSLVGRADLSHLIIKSKDDEININYFKGLINFEKNKDLSLIEINDFAFKLDNGFILEDVKLKFGINNAQDLESLFLSINDVNLESATKIMPYLPPKFEGLKKQVETISAKGNVKDLVIKWKKGDDFFNGLNLNMQVSDLSTKPFQGLPGIDNLNATFKIKDRSGSIVSKSENLVFTKLDTFREPLRFDQISGELKWKDNIFNIINLNISNTDLAATLNATYKESGQDDEIDLQISIPRSDISGLKEYYPIKIGKEGLNWLDTSLLKGQAIDTKIRLKGKLKDFPFIDEKNQPEPNEGVFEITSKIKGATIEYGAGWPLVENFDIDLDIKGSQIQLTSSSGHILNNQFKLFKGKIASFADNQPMLQVDIVTDSPINFMLNAINNSPIKQAMKGTSEDMKGNGPGELNLYLNIPMKNVDDITYEGTYTFNGSSLENPSLDLPLLTNINGQLLFNSQTVSIKNANATLLEQRLAVSLNNKNDITLIDINGSIGDELIRSKFGDEGSKRISGNTEWHAEFKLKEKESEFTLTTDLNGIAINNLQDFNKESGESIPLTIKKRSPSDGRDYIDISYGSLVNAKLIRGKNNKINQGFIGINTVPIMPKKGVTLVANLKNFNTEDYESIFKDLTGGDTISKEKVFDPFIDNAQLNFDELIIESNKLTKATVDYLPTTNGLKININSNEAVGSITYVQSNHFYKAEFEKIHLVRNINQKNKKEEISSVDLMVVDGKKIQVNENTNLIDMNINSFKVNDVEYGKVSLKAHDNKEGIVFDDIRLVKESNTIRGSGYWNSESFPQKTSLDFQWDIRNIGDTLTGLGYPNLVDKGEATISGLITWDNGPSKFDSQDFYGNFNLIAKKGNVQKISPGITGRLVGLLSLQNLPKRLTLDFSDLFQEGLPFDRIESNETIINKGILSSKALKMDGPSAQTLMNGKIDFINETQDLYITIRPKVSDTATVGALIGGPLAAAAVFIAQKILDDPLNKITTAEYRVTGSWDDPKEIKLESNSGAAGLIDKAILNPAGKVINTTGEVIDGLLIKPSQDLIDFIFSPNDKPKKN